MLDIYCPEDQYHEEWDVRRLAEASMPSSRKYRRKVEGMAPEHLKELGRDALSEELRRAH